MKILMRNKLFIGLLAGIFLCLPACKTSKEFASFAGKSDQEIFNDVAENSLKFRTLSGKLDVDIKTPKRSLGAKANIKIVKDKVIQLSIQPFGIEAFKVEFSVDSIKIVDRLNQRYAVERFSELKGNFQLDFNFYNLQALFTNSLFIAGKTDISSDDFNRFSFERSDKKVLIGTKDEQGIQYLFIGDYSNKIQSLYMSESSSRISILSDYSNFNPLSDSQKFPMDMKLALKTPSDSDMQLNFTYSKVELDRDFDTEFSIPSKYRRIRLSDAFQFIQGL